MKIKIQKLQSVIMVATISTIKSFPLPLTPSQIIEHLPKNTPPALSLGTLRVGISGCLLA